MPVRFTALFAFALISSVVHGGDLATNELINGGGSSESDGMWITSPSLYLRCSHPGVMFGMVRPPGQSRAIAYVFIIKGDEKRTTFAQFIGESRAVGIPSNAGAHASSKGSLVVAGQKMSFVYSIRSESIADAKPTEMLIVDGNAVDLGKGRILLIDLSGRGDKLKQVSAELPNASRWSERTEQVEVRSKQIVQELHRHHHIVRDFLK
jgi:hypothetical protein